MILSKGKQIGVMLMRGGIVYIQALFHIILPYQKMLNFISFFLGQHLIWIWGSLTLTQWCTLMGVYYKYMYCFCWLSGCIMVMYLVNAHSLQHNNWGDICPDRVLTPKLIPVFCFLPFYETLAFPSPLEWHINPICYSSLSCMSKLTFLSM